MTIAACYLSMEGVVFGADSTSTIGVPNAAGQWESHHFDYGQKIFEVGVESQLGVAVWGLGSFGSTSYRTLVAELGDDLKASPARNGEQIVAALGDKVWKAFEDTFDKSMIQDIRDIGSRDATDRTPEEQERLDKLGSLGGGFCVGGCYPPSRNPWAYEVTFGLLAGVGSPESIARDKPSFWGAPNMVDRLIWGIDFGLYEEILNSGHWSGTKADLAKLVSGRRLLQPENLPLREAIDWVYASVFATIKVFKFSQFQPICGGPVEIGVISTDRPFRWVRHKNFDAAI